MEKKDSKNTVFYISLVIIAVMAVWSVALNESFTAASNAAFAFLTTDFGWLYLVSMIVFLIFVVYVAFGKYGRIRLGGDDSRPEYKNLTWFGLLFGCGMGVGLVFWGVAEPLTHYLNPVGMEGGTPITRFCHAFLLHALGDPAVGELCGDRPCPCVFYVPQG